MLQLGSLISTPCWWSSSFLVFWKIFETLRKSFEIIESNFRNFRGGLQIVIPQLIQVVKAYALRFWAVTHLIRYALVWVTTARLSPITQYIVFYPDLLAVGGGTLGCLEIRKYLKFVSFWPFSNFMSYDICHKMS